ncbi:Sporulation-specific N-acetylmuramoyl-L-alanine amidase [Paraliobacillus sp. PM-2]|uniref:N-acetylmuramoyl-L-alanine amidase n=1 Tax=Paraliobacillus sp. PM-2 TaxID=1462524 RepID=UPI00061CBCBC|nr:N-acetylmuramoyl-L-alanine amidase [Paraliobacillus sp. PM-2]CQR47863.1 Sporulation-specific N-acetylmuramoyl-L-alanine amidase [Paraliobacillus sp. PM-2]
MCIIIIIDPGHGGKDKGGGSNSSWLEKDFMLKLSLYQYARLQELHIPVEMTRYTDKYLSSNERSKCVLLSDATYCISNHINAGGGVGAELIHSIYSDGSNARILAKQIEEKQQKVRRIFTRTLSFNDRMDYYYMHRDTGHTETIIVEYGFADSKVDRIKLSRDWRDLAEAVVKGICIITNTPYYNKTYVAEEMNKSDAWYIGKRVESKVDGLRYYYFPDWSDQSLVNTIDKGIGFPEIVDKLIVGKGEQYKVKNSKGNIYYITANQKYVQVN